MIGSNLGQIGIGNVQVNGDEASAPLVVNGQEVPAYMKFNKKDGDWRIDVTSMMSLAEKGMEMMLQKSGKSRKEFVSQLIMITTQEQDVDSLWEPVGK
ncbi:MAG: hypothetical protein WBB45_00190 [Cyclobacteriaceae bacterium]